MLDFFRNLLPIIAALLLSLPVWINYRRLGWQLTTYLSVLLWLGGLGGSLILFRYNATDYMGIWYVVGMLLLTLGGMTLFYGVMEFGLLRLIGLFRLGAIARVTYYEGLLQPFSLIVMASGIATIGVCARLGFFTYYEDFKMYRDVATSFVFLFSMPIMVFASTKVIDEEIENRTMLTLMSKPVSRTQVVLGKYLGVLLLILAAVVTMGAWAIMCSYLRYFDDMSIDFAVAKDEAERTILFLNNTKAILALFPSLLLTFMQVAALGAVSVAISTRFGLAVNITVVAIIYIGANLASFLGTDSTLPASVRSITTVLTYLLPGLTQLDLNQRLIFGNFVLGKLDWIPGLPSYGLIWEYVGLAAVYWVFYTSAVLSFGVALFRSRELS